MADTQRGGNRGGTQNRDYDDDDRGQRRGRQDDDDGRGWFGDPEGHAEAGRQGGEAVSRDRRHMAEIGRLGGLAHHEAASHHEAAAHHHRQAGHYTEEGDDENARRHSARAHEHSTRAHESSYRAHSQSQGQGRGWFGDQEGHAEAGRKGGQSRDDDDDNQSARSRGSSRGGSSRSDDDDDNQSSSRGTSRGGTHEQHVAAGRKGGQA